MFSCSTLTGGFLSCLDGAAYCMGRMNSDCWYVCEEFEVFTVELGAPNMCYILDLCFM